MKREGKNTAKDSLAEPVVRGTTQFNEDSNPGGTLFNEYVNPESDAVWNDEAMELTGLSGSDPRISSARGLNDVWASFSKYVAQHIGEDERGVIVAYNGAGSDMKWLWRLTQAPTSTQSMPERLDYYMDPLKIIKKWKRCPLNAINSKLDCFALGSVWSHIHEGRRIPNLHDSLVDARAQADIILCSSFVPWLDRTDTLATADKIFGARQLSELKKELEPIRPVHDPWAELNKTSDLNW